MKTTKEQQEIRHARTIINNLRVKGYARLMNLCKKYGRINLAEPLKLKGLMYPITAIYYGKLKNWLSDGSTEALVAVIDRGDDDGGIVKLPTHIDLIANLRNAESLYQLIEKAEEVVEKSPKTITFAPERQ